MKKMLFSLFLFLFLGCVPQDVETTYPEQSRSNRIQNTLMSTGVLVKHLDILNENRNFCSGFFWNDYFVTAAHCVDEEFLDYSVVTYHNYLQNKNLEAPEDFLLLDLDIELDIAILIPAQESIYQNLILALEPPKRGDFVYSLSSPSVFTFSYFEGVVSHPKRVRQRVEVFWTQLNMTILPGASGAPTLNRDGEVVGVCQFYVNTEITGILYLEEMRGFLDQYRSN